MPAPRLQWTPLRGGSPPRHVVVYDTEAMADPSWTGPGERQRFRLAVGQYHRYRNGRYRLQSHGAWWDVWSWWDWLLSIIPRRATIWVCSHNANYDWRIIDLLGALRRYGLSLARPERPGRDEAAGPLPAGMMRAGLFSTRYHAAFCELRRGGRRLLLVDSLNLLPMALSKIGQAVGSTKGTMPADDAPHAEWEAYCRRDVDVLAQALLGLLSRIGERHQTKPGLTLASTAFRVFRRRHLGQPLALPDRPGQRAVHRRAFYGGRVDVAHIGSVAGPIYPADVRSMYPAVMRAHVYPGEWRETIHGGSTGVLAWALRYYCLIAHVRLRAREWEYPLRVGQRVRYVRGHCDTWLAGPEVERALQAGEILGVHQVELFDRLPLFRSYVDALWDDRRQALAADDGVGALLAKLLMNSLYGKTVQRGEEYRYAVIPDEGDIGEVVTEIHVPTGERRTLERFGPLARWCVERGDAPLAHPAVGAYVTSYARVLVDAAKRLAGPRGWVYSDTDSLFLTQAGLDRALAGGLDVGDGLGQWVIDGPLPWITIHGKKDYECGCRVCRGRGRVVGGVCERCRGVGHVPKIKGVRQTAVPVHGPERRDVLAQQGLSEMDRLGRFIRVFRQHHFHSLADVWNVGWDARVHVEPVHKVLAHVYDDGVIGADGWVTPVTLAAGDQTRLETDPTAWAELLACSPCSAGAARHTTAGTE